MRMIIHKNTACVLFFYVMWQPKDFCALLQRREIVLCVCCLACTVLSLHRVTTET